MEISTALDNTSHANAKVNLFILYKRITSMTNQVSQVSEHLLRMEQVLATHKTALQAMTDGHIRDDLLRRTRDLKLRLHDLRRMFEPSQSSAIHQLPNELLLLVFEAMQPALSVQSHTLREAQYTQAALTAVSRRWRALMLSTPSLWSIVYAGAGSEALLRRAMLYFARSKECLLDIVVELGLPRSCEDPPEDKTDLARMCTILVPVLRTSVRWRSLRVEAGTDLQRRVATTALENVHAPALVDFTLWLGHIPPDDEEIDHNFVPALAFGGGAPALRTVCMQGCNWPWCALPSVGLTSLRLEVNNFDMEMDYEDLRSLLTSAPMLAEFSLLGERTTVSLVDSDFAQPPITLLSLQQLHLDYESLRVCQLFCTPVLHTLAAAYVDTPALLDFLAFVARGPATPYPALRTLRICPAWFPPDGACDALGTRMPAVQHLTLDGRLCPAVLAAAAAAPDTWPALATIATHALDKPTLKALVRARGSAAGGALRAFALDPVFVRALELDYPDVLAWACAQGVDVCRGSEKYYDRDWRDDLQSWEDGSEESVYGMRLLVGQPEA